MDYLDEFSSSDWQQFFNELGNDARSFYESDKVFDHASYLDNIASIKDKTLPHEGVDFDALLHDIRTNIIPGSIHQHSQNYLAFPDKGAISAAQYTALLNVLINQNAIAEDKSAPTGTYIELLVISWLRRMIGYQTDDAFPSNALELGGAFVTGGVMANTIGLLGARQRAFPQSKQRGMHAINAVPKIFVAGPTMNHYSHFGSSWWLGFGTDNIVEVACTESGNMDQTDLEAKIKASLASGEKPVAVVALAGDSRTNTIDDLPGLYAITQRYDLWLHADACHGGILLFDDTFTHGNHHFLWYCDSISIDPHKHLGTPYASSIVLFKNALELANIGSSTDITIAYGSNDVGQITPFLGSRTLDALKLYAVMQQYGVNGIKQHIAKRRKLAKTWYKIISSSTVLTAMHEPELFALAFSIRPTNTMDAKEVSARNKALHDALHKDGNVVLHMFDMCDYRNILNFGAGTRLKILGSTIGSDRYTEDDLRTLAQVIETTYLRLHPTT